jgi:hypothetical protein
LTQIAIPSESTPRRFQVVAAGFAAGALAHAWWLLGTLLNLAPLPGYAAWRHAPFVLIDAGLAYLAARRPRLLLLPLVALLAQQATTHGANAWRTWDEQHQVGWYDSAILAFLAGGVLLSAEHIVKSRRGAARVDPGAR